MSANNSMTHRERFLAACNCQPVDKTPIWIMRQAGRYLPEYRTLKKQYSFLQLVKTPELAAEVSLQPMRRFDFDAAIIFSDILVIPEALGQPYHFTETGGIEMDYKVDNSDLIDRLEPSGLEDKLGYIGEAMRLVRTQIGDKTALIGFGGSPWTLAVYMIEGSASGDIATIKSLYRNEPQIFNRLLEKIKIALIDLFLMKIQAGADAIQIFDSWANLCPSEAYEDMSLRWIKEIIQALPQQIPIIVYAKGMASQVRSLADTGAKVLSMDGAVRLGDLRAKLPGDVALQGNLEPSIMDADDPEIVRLEALKILKEMKPHNGHIFNLGHGIRPTAKVENVAVLVETVHQFS